MAVVSYIKRFLWHPTTRKHKERVESHHQKPKVDENSHNNGNDNQKGPTSPEAEWVISVKAKLDQAHHEDGAGSWSELCIYRVPQCLREGDAKAYIPQVVSLGPYHHGGSDLRNMDDHKWRALDHVLNRTNQGIELFLDAMKELEQKARACYDGSITLSSHQFVEMMVLDGCFILELFCGSAKGFEQLGYSTNDPVFSVRGPLHSIIRDMIMLENQIPMFILDRLFQIGKWDQQGTVAKLAIRFLDQLMPTEAPLSDLLANQGAPHCLEIFRQCILGPKGPKPRSNYRNRAADKPNHQLIHRVMELKGAGIAFKKRKKGRFWYIKFKNGVLKMPRLFIHDGTKSLFLNLIAFEQCHLDCTNHITSYVVFMDHLINSDEDVSYLHDCGIIEHWLGSDAEVAEMFNRLCREVIFDSNDSYLSSLSEDVNNYYDHKWNAQIALLKHKYFNSPWSIISFIAAVVLLLMTFLQTFYGIYGYYRPSS